MAPGPGRRRGAAIVLAALQSACASQWAHAPAPIVRAAAETAPVSSFGDAADDAAIWVHPTDPARTLIIVTDKRRGLEVHALDGSLKQRLPVGRMNNVDLRDGFALGGHRVTVVAASDRDHDAIALFTISPDRPELNDVADGLRTTGLTRIYGLCMFADRVSDRLYVFVNDKDGRYQQHELLPTVNGRIATRVVREFRVPTRPEGCVADDELGWLYVGEESVGVHRIAAAADAPATFDRVDRVGGGQLVAHVEGIAIYRPESGQGYLLVSSQGDDAYAVYRREPPNEFVGRFRIGDGIVDGTSGTDGLEVASQPLPPPYDEGLLVVQDGLNTAPLARQNFKLIPWSAVRQVLPGPAEPLPP
jgi:3-phytase